MGIQNVDVSADGALTVTLTNGTVLNLGNIKGADGLGITKAEINTSGELVLTYSNGDVKISARLPVRTVRTARTAPTDSVLSRSHFPRTASLWLQCPIIPYPTSAISREIKATRASRVSRDFRAPKAPTDEE